MWKQVKRLGLGLIIGTGVGAVAGLLMAPDGGEEMRARIKAEYKRILQQSEAAAEQKRLALQQELAAKIANPEQPTLPPQV